MNQIAPIMFVMTLIFVLIMGVIYEPAWQELLRSRQARRRREEHAREES